MSAGAAGAPLFDPNAPETLADPHAAYRRLRDEAPAYFIAPWRTWAISRFEDLWTWAGDAEHFTATAGTTAPYLVTGAIERLVGEGLNGLDEGQSLAGEDVRVGQGVLGGN